MKKAKQISVSLENKPGRLGLGAKKSYIVVGASNINAAAKALQSKK